MFDVYYRSKDENALEVDFEAFDFSMPKLTLASSIGKGLNFVSKYITAKLSGSVDNTQPLVDYLLSLEYQGEVYLYICIYAYVHICMIKCKLMVVFSICRNL